MLKMIYREFDTFKKLYKDFRKILKLTSYKSRL